MSPAEAAAAVEIKVKAKVQDTRNQVDARLMLGANQLRNAELDVLTNPSPSAPGNPPGMRSRDLRKNWTMYSSGGGGNGKFGIRSGMDYSSYLENGTHNEDGSQRMAARPYVEKIKEAALPDILSIFRKIGG